MGDIDKSYLEIKVTFQHILVLLLGVFLIGSFLFYLGYKVGKNSTHKAPEANTALKNAGGEDPLIAKGDSDKIESVSEPSISDEIKLHRQPQPDDNNNPPADDPNKQTQTADREENPTSDDPAAGKDVEIKIEDKKPTSKKENGKKEPVKKEKPASRESSFAIQVGAFNSYDLAKDYSRRFSREGYPTSISQGTVSGKTWYRVRVGSYKSREDAKKARTKLEKTENKKFTIVIND